LLLIFLVFTSHRSLVASCTTSSCFSHRFQLLLASRSVASRNSISCFSLINQLLLTPQSIATPILLSCFLHLNQLLLTPRSAASIASLSYSSYLAQFLLSCITIFLILLSLQLHSTLSVATPTLLTCYTHLAHLLLISRPVATPPCSVASRISLASHISLYCFSNLSLSLLTSL
jgi:hypothetical protein